MTVASLAARALIALSVSEEYLSSVEAGIRDAMRSLLRRYNFPKQLKRRTYAELIEAQQSFSLPSGIKKILLASFYDPQEVAWTDPLKRRESFVRPQADGVPRHYWLEGVKLWIDTPLISGYTRAQLKLFYQSQLVEDNEDWLSEDFEDIVFNYSVYRMATATFRKPEVQQAFSPLWQADQTELAIYLNELEFDGLEMMMRETRDARPARYPTCGGRQ